MNFPPAAESGGRARACSQHERDDGDVVSAVSGIPAARAVSSAADAEKATSSSSSSSNLTGDLNKLYIATSTAASSFCPAIITPTRAPAALGFDKPAASGAGCASAVGDSFLGFGPDAPPPETWEGDSVGGRGGRTRAPSSDNVDLGAGAGCDLGWGGLDAADDSAGSRERGRGEEEEADESYACDYDAEGR